MFVNCNSVYSNNFTFISNKFIFVIYIIYAIILVIHILELRTKINFYHLLTKLDEHVINNYIIEL